MRMIVMMENNQIDDVRAMNMGDLLIDKKTGLVITEDSEPIEIARVLRSVSMEIKRLEKFKEKLMKLAMDQLGENDDMYGEYFEVVRVPPRINEREDIKQLSQTQKKAFLKAKNQYEMYKGEVFRPILMTKSYTKYLKMPKFDREI